MKAAAPPLFVKRDLDGFFGLFIDNLVQLLVIGALAVAYCGLERDFVFGRILPGAAISVLLGNVYYAWQARAVARREGRDDVTALPYGINTPSVFAFIFFIMAPVYSNHREALGDEAAARLAWQIGLIACIGSGLIEFGGAFVAERIRRATPRAALLAALAGIAIGFISMDFILQVFERPLLALVPMGIILLQYTSGARLPWGLPAGLVALLAGAALGWSIWGVAHGGWFASLPAVVQHELALEISSMPASGAAFVEALRPAPALPSLALAEIADVFRGPHIGLLRDYLGVIIPMGLFNLVGSLQNIESAEAAGDRFATAPSLAVNGAGTLAAAAFGSCFPTTIYIGHVGWKRLGARSGYSLLDGVAIAAICLLGVVGSFSALVPTEAVVGILLWIAIAIVAQAFQTVPREHAPAVALGMIPGIAAWGLLVFKNGMSAAGGYFGAAEFSAFAPEWRVGGLVALDRGFILSSMGLAALCVMTIERRLAAAAGWAWAMAALSLFGVIHAWNPLALGDSATIGWATGWRFAIAYGIWGAILFALRRRVKADRRAGEEIRSTSTT